MSEWHPEVVQIGKVGKVPDSDNLEITTIYDGYPCIFRCGDFTEGNLAAYIPIDSLVPVDREEFKFLTPRANKYGYVRIKAMRLRGIFSMGLLVKISTNMNIGDSVTEYFGLKKYEPDLSSVVGLNEVDKGILPTYTDIEGYRKYSNVIQEGEQVVLLEKIHGENFRALHDGERLWIGSHHRIKSYSLDTPWWQAAEKYKLEEKLKMFPELAFYGEMYGQQKHFLYDSEVRGKNRLRFFDIKNIETEKYLDYDSFIQIIQLLELESVPLLYRGPWNPSLIAYAEGKSCLNSDTIREGFVVKPLIERWDPKIRRTILKFISQDYLLSKNS